MTAEEPTDQAVQMEAQPAQPESLPILTFNMRKNKENRQKKMTEEKNVDPNKPKRPASSFFLFSKEAMKNLVEERPGINNSTITALISVKWKEMSDEEKQSWNEKAGEAMDAYKKELEAYNNSKVAAAKKLKNKDH
ncbi:HMG mobility box protein [Perilla frutescens var. frutescens]|nr:HMG mobility box protein [Perilla frutescens var. frutescens]